MLLFGIITNRYFPQQITYQSFIIGSIQMRIIIFGFAACCYVAASHAQPILKAPCGCAQTWDAFTYSDHNDIDSLFMRYHPKMDRPVSLGWQSPEVPLSIRGLAPKVPGANRSPICYPTRWTVFRIFCATMRVTVAPHSIGSCRMDRGSNLYRTPEHGEMDGHMLWV